VIYVPVCNETFPGYHFCEQILSWGIERSEMEADHVDHTQDKEHKKLKESSEYQVIIRTIDYLEVTYNFDQIVVFCGVNFLLD
jgi:hypothetical protein